MRDRGIHHFHQGDREYVIATSYWAKPDPCRSCDWSAVDDRRYDGPGCPIGYGSTKQDAINDLMDQINEDENYWP